MDTWRRGCESAHCLEVDMEPAWIKACDTAACVEVQDTDTIVKIRNSNDPGVVLKFTYDEWAQFKEGVINGTFG